MTYELNIEEKTSIIWQHLRNLEFKIYNFSLSLIEEQATASPNANKLAEINGIIDEVNAQKSALLLELESLV
jgi:hypothetical protein